MKYSLIHKNDQKVKSLRKELYKLNYELISMPGNPILIPISIIKNIIKKGKPESVVYRYLNDFKSKQKTVIRLISEYFELKLLRIFKIKVIWICHNVDRETFVTHPNLNNTRRNTMAKNANHILVTDKGLQQYAIDKFPLYKYKIDYITFGEMKNHEEYEHTTYILNTFKEFIKFHKEKNNNQQVYFTLCAGKANHKTLHFEKLLNLINSTEGNSSIIRAVIIGPLSSYYGIRNKELLNDLKNDDRILFLDGFFKFNEAFLADDIDFYWRVYNDYSVPGTVYTAMKQKTPILTQKYGYLHHLVKEENIGFIINDDFSNVGQTLSNLNTWDVKASCNFIESRNWEQSANKLLSTINVDN